MQILEGVAALVFFLGGLAAAAFAVAAFVRRKNAEALRKLRTFSIASAILAVASFIVFAIISPPDKAAEVPAANATGSARPSQTVAGPDSSVLRYMTLRPGWPLYLDSPEDHGVLFDSLDTTKRWAMGQFVDDGNPDGPQDLPHVDVPLGALVLAESWAEIPQASGDGKRVVVKVRESGGAHREGWADGIFLVPQLPAGTTLVAYSYRGPALMTISEPSAKKSKFLNLTSGTRVSLIKTTVTDALDHFYGRVLTGPYSGRRGWFSNLTARVLSPPIITADGDYYPVCECVSLYVKTSWKLGMPTREPSETPSTSSQ